MNQILSGVPVESLCLTSGILLSAKSYDTPIRIWQMLSNENARLGCFKKNGISFI